MRSVKNFLIAVILNITFVNVINCEEVLVEISNGVLRGTQRDSFYAFEGIPYAQAPIGNLRFASPHTYTELWTEIRNATEPGAHCMQWDHFADGDSKLQGTEDCLFVNVYTNDLSPEEPLPVIFFIHGGAFMFGYGDFYGPEYLLEKPMIVVTFNYRLGPLGFLSTEDDVVPGNFGLKDQNLALKWVQQNIKHFGGDAKRITIAGFSAGGASTHLHYLSPLSKDLFQNGIAHSGTALSPWVFAEKSAKKAKVIAKELGCPTSSSELLKCLREKQAEEIVNLVPLFLDFLYNPFSPFGAVVETKTTNNPEPFITDYPTNILKSGQFYKAPIIMSLSEAEGLYPAAEFYSDEKYLEILDQRWNKFMPSVLDYKNTVDEAKKDKVSKAIRKHYLKGETLTKASFGNFTQAVSDRLYNYGVAKSAKLQQANAPVYVYFNKFKSIFGVSEFLSKTNENLGVAHGDDVLLFYKTGLRDANSYSESEKQIAAKFIQMYYDFATSGVPSYGDISFLPMDCAEHIKYLDISDANTAITRVAENFGGEKFWDTIGLKEL